MRTNHGSNMFQQISSSKSRILQVVLFKIHKEEAAASQSHNDELVTQGKKSLRNWSFSAFLEKNSYFASFMAKL